MKTPMYRMASLHMVVLMQLAKAAHQKGDTSKAKLNTKLNELSYGL